MSVQYQAKVGPTLARALALDAINVLAALSADDVTPLAMLQAEAVGQQFPINGDLTSRVLNLLLRCSSTRLDMLRLVIGWRHGDAVSQIAFFFDGQAAAILSLCLCEIFRSEMVGEIIYHISKQLLSTLTNAGVLQLNKVGKLLAEKLSPASLGNKLAELVTQIRLVYLEHN